MKDLPGQQDHSNGFRYRGRPLRVLAAQVADDEVLTLAECRRLCHALEIADDMIMLSMIGDGLTIIGGVGSGNGAEVLCTDFIVKVGVLANGLPILAVLDRTSFGLMFSREVEAPTSGVYVLGEEEAAS